jgi:hypothetical protein
MAVRFAGSRASPVRAIWSARQEDVDAFGDADIVFNNAQALGMAVALAFAPRAPNAVMFSLNAAS